MNSNSQTRGLREIRRDLNKSAFTFLLPPLPMASVHIENINFFLDNKDFPMVPEKRPREEEKEEEERPAKRLRSPSPALDPVSSFPSESSS
jgi:hypothetical protein